MAKCSKSCGAGDTNKIHSLATFPPKFWSLCSNRTYFNLAPQMIMMFLIRKIVFGNKFISIKVPGVLLFCIIFLFHNGKRTCLTHTWPFLLVISIKNYPIYAMLFSTKLIHNILLNKTWNNLSKIIIVSLHSNSVV